MKGQGCMGTGSHGGDSIAVLALQGRDSLVPRLRFRVGCHRLLPPWTRKVSPGLRSSRMFERVDSAFGKAAGFLS